MLLWRRCGPVRSASRVEAMSLSADLYFSFRSPYSALAIPRYRALADSHDLEIALRPVYPLAVRDPQFFSRANRLQMAYVLQDVARLAQFHGIPITYPQPDPIVQDLQTGAIAAQQPYIHRITRLGQAAARAGQGLAFADEAARLIWCGTKGWHEGDHLARAAERCGLDFAALEQVVADDADSLDAEIAVNAQSLHEAGHWGVPTLVFEGEPFFGQDRIDLAIWRMRQAGLQER